MLSWNHILVIAFIYSVGRFFGERIIDIYQNIRDRIDNYMYYREHPEEECEDLDDWDDEY